MTKMPLQTIMVKRHETKKGWMLSAYPSDSLYGVKIRVEFPKQHKFDIDDIARAAQAVAQQIGWGGEYVVGHIGTAHWVFVNKASSPTVFFLDFDAS